MYNILQTEEGMLWRKGRGWGAKDMLITSFWYLFYILIFLWISLFKKN